ncbi:peptide deformylase [Acinetobacter sp. ANC 4558]|uniref:peptide deformylase n=1 Tax=Acinetobacter sp. ANC 4558 TaxID=1977876 RepID=UPI000A3374BB|nr:peptide deformylase [Acinetobacter sp. ANC 4558]OTG86214.1 peptide deformylase [Acinetobacter sp. ANC 4558]
MGTLLPVAQKGEGVLALKASVISQAEFNSQWLYQLTEAMHATMLERNGVGIAAPQVYISKRVIIVASKPNPRYPDAPEMSPIIMINPEIVWMSEQENLGEEGCLSVQNERGSVRRANEIQVHYFDLDGTKFELRLSGFPARIVQHEVDHLNGILFVERLSE